MEALLDRMEALVGRLEESSARVTGGMMSGASAAPPQSKEEREAEERKIEKILKEWRLDQSPAMEAID